MTKARTLRIGKALSRPGQRRLSNTNSWELLSTQPQTEDQRLEKGDSIEEEEE